MVDYLRRARFRRQLQDQLRFIRRSCEAFDDGDRAEAIRIAGVARTLLKDGNPKRKPATRSLLTHMDARRIRLLSTVAPLTDPRLVYGSGMTRFHMGPQGPSVDPMLGTSSARSFVPVDAWWAEHPIYVERKQPLYRRDVILIAAEKDGAAAPFAAHLRGELVWRH